MRVKGRKNFERKTDKLRKKLGIKKPIDPPPPLKTSNPTEEGPFCGALLTSGAVDAQGLRKRCRNRAGYGTPHPGQGRCKRHGGCGSPAAVKTGLYSKLTHVRIRNILDEIEANDKNLMDLMPEANLLRSMTIDYVNRFEEFNEALMAWYLDKESKQRPRRVMDIQDAAHLVESISRVVHRMHQIQSEGAISLDTFRRVTEHMGMIVAQVLKKVPDAPALLAQIEEKWSELALDARAPTSSTSSRAIDEE